MKYRKKPVVIEAIQWGLDNIDEVLEFGGEFTMVEEMASGQNLITITTLETNGEVKTRHAMSVFDYLIKGVKGEFYACKPDIFELTYEKLND